MEVKEFFQELFNGIIDELKHEAVPGMEIMDLNKIESISVEKDGLLLLNNKYTITSEGIKVLNIDTEKVPDQLIEKKNNKIKELEEKLQENNKVIEDMKKNIGNIQNGDIEEKDNYIEELENEIKQKDEIIDNIKKEAQESAPKVIKMKDEEIETLNKELLDKEKELDMLRDRLKKENIKSGIDEKNKEIKKLQDQLEEKNGEIIKLKQDVLSARGF